jgi:hypothetical protein
MYLSRVLITNDEKLVFGDVTLIVLACQSTRSHAEFIVSDGVRRPQKRLRDTRSAATENRGGHGAHEQDAQN